MIDENKWNVASDDMKIDTIRAIKTTLCKDCITKADYDLMLIFMLDKLDAYASAGTVLTEVEKAYTEADAKIYVEIMQQIAKLEKEVLRLQKSGPEVPIGPITC